MEFKGKLISKPEFPQCEICNQYKYSMHVSLLNYDEKGKPRFRKFEGIDDSYTHLCRNCGSKYWFNKK